MKSFTRTLKGMIVINLLIGVLFLVWPGAHADAGATVGMRGLGLMLILLSLALAPAAFLPLANRYLALLAAVAQATLGVYFVFAGPQFRWLLAVYAFVTAGALVATFWRGFRDDLMARP